MQNSCHNMVGKVRRTMQQLPHAGDQGGPRASQLLPDGTLPQASVVSASLPLAQERPTVKIRARGREGQSLIKTQVYQLPDFRPGLFCCNRTVLPQRSGTFEMHVCACMHASTHTRTQNICALLSMQPPLHVHMHTHMYMLTCMHMPRTSSHSHYHMLMYSHSHSNTCSCVCTCTPAHSHTTH